MFRGLHHRADGLHRHILVGPGDDHVLLVVQADLRLAGGHQGDGVVGVGGELDVDLQALLLVVALLDGVVEEGVEGVGVPVQHHVQLPQLPVRAAGLAGGWALRSRSGGAAGEQEQGAQGKSQLLFHLPSFLSFPVPYPFLLWGATTRRAAHGSYDSPRQRTK